MIFAVFWLLSFILWTYILKRSQQDLSSRKTKDAMMVDTNKATKENTEGSPFFFNRENFFVTL